MNSVGWDRLSDGLGKEMCGYMSEIPPIDLRHGSDVSYLLAILH